MDSCGVATLVTPQLCWNNSPWVVMNLNFFSFKQQKNLHHSDKLSQFAIPHFTCHISKASHVIKKLDGVGPVDNRPYTDKLHHFVQKKTQQKHDMWHVRRDMWHVRRDTWHVLGRGNILSKFQLPSSYLLWFMILWRSGGKGWVTEWINQSVTRLFIEQPRLHRVC